VTFTTTEYLIKHKS